jgi:O-glycosyl hydrolase
MHKIRFFLEFFLLASVSMAGQKKSITNLDININEEYQVIHSFGASDAWRCQFVGKNWPESKKTKMAEWLFSKEMDKKGNPKGIGLSMWRFNIGAGSMEQGDSSGIINPWRRVECFLNADGTYDWSKQEGQQWFLKQAHIFGVENTLAFPNSAPLYYTINEKAFSPKNRTNLNLKNGKFRAYAAFLSEVCEYFENEGLGFNYLSPFNEPLWGWSDPTQEGTPAGNEELFLLTHLIDHEFSKRGLKTELALGEAAEYDFLYEKSGEHPGSSSQLKDFADPESSLFIGQFSNAAPVFSGHGYFTTWPVEKLIEARQNLRDALDTINPVLDFWQSEFCILENSEDIGGGNQRDLGMATALYVARVIHFDLTLANAASWQWWTALSQCNYKDGLIYLDNGNDGISSQQHPDNEKLKYDGNFHDSKLMWALGNYSRFVRPGMVRIAASFNDVPLEDQATSLMVSAYKNSAANEVVLVAANYSEMKQHIVLNNPDFFKPKVKTYLTSATKNLAFAPALKDDLAVEPGSVKTFILEY